MRGGVAITANDGHARLGEAVFGANDMDDAPVGAVHAVELDAEIAAVLLHLADLVGRNGIGNGHIQRGGGDAVVHGGQSLARPSHRQPLVAQPLKRLWRSHLVDEVQINVQDGWAVPLGHNQMLIPNFVVKCAWCGHKIEGRDRDRGGTGRRRLSVSSSFC